MIKRNIACKLKPVLTIEINADSSGFAFSNDQKNKGAVANFKFGQDVEDEIGGAAGTSNWTFDGSQMKGKFTFKKNPGNFTETVRKIENGKLVQTLSFKGKVSKRVFKKI